jgi:hypothetical protein
MARTAIQVANSMVPATIHHKISQDTNSRRQTTVALHKGTMAATISTNHINSIPISRQRETTTKAVPVVHTLHISSMISSSILRQANNTISIRRVRQMDSTASNMLRHLSITTNSHMTRAIHMELRRVNILQEDQQMRIAV